jgi:exopolysaccharide biosynthesis operon protein EpsL
MVQRKNQSPEKMQTHLSAMSTPRRTLRSLAPVLGALLCLPAHAATDDVLRPYLSYTWQHDDNLLRLYDAATARALLGSDERADLSRRAEGGLLLEKKIGQQQLAAKLGFSHVNFSRFSELDYAGRDLSARWNWHIGPHLEGNVGATDVKALTPYVDFHRLERNLRTQRREFVDAAWRLHPSWRARGGLSHYQLGYDLASQRAGDRTEDAAEVGLDYLAANQSSVGLQLRHLRGAFPNQEQIGTLLVDNSYQQNELMGKVDWALTGKTRLQFLAGHVTRSHRFAPTRDFSGVNAHAIATWNPTVKTSVRVNAWRETGSYNDLTTRYTINNGISVTPSWAISAKARLEGLLKQETRSFDASAAGAHRRDTFRYASLTMTYLPLPRLQLAAVLYRDRQDSTQAFTGYRANGATVSARYDF